MLLQIELNSLRETRAMEYVRRFAFGGAVTVLASLIAQKWGPVVGGMFLAFPGIFPPGLSLVESHKIEREKAEGKEGMQSARGEAAVEAAGASAGTLGLVAFAVVVWKGLPGHSLPVTLAEALGAWAVVSWCAWWVRERM